MELLNTFTDKLAAYEDAAAKLDQQIKDAETSKIEATQALETAKEELAAATKRKVMENDTQGFQAAQTSVNKLTEALKDAELRVQYLTEDKDQLQKDSYNELAALERDMGAEKIENEIKIAQTIKDAQDQYLSVLDTALISDKKYHNVITRFKTLGLNAGLRIRDDRHWYDFNRVRYLKENIQRTALKQGINSEFELSTKALWLNVWGVK
ncbi:hypothetical protein ACEOWG_002151 [Bacillus cereus]